jgi:hypothetical protein
MEIPSILAGLSAVVAYYTQCLPAEVRLHGVQVAKQLIGVLKMVEIKRMVFTTHSRRHGIFSLNSAISVLLLTSPKIGLTLDRLN